MFEREIKYYPLFKTQAANGVSIPVDARDFKTAQLTVVGSGGAAFDVKVRASLQKEPPDFTKAASASNRWQYVQYVDLETGSFYTDLAPYTFASNVVKQFELNTNGIAWFALEISGYATGSIEADATVTSNI